MTQPHEHANGCCESSINRYRQPVSLATIAEDAQAGMTKARAVFRTYFPAKRKGYSNIPPILAGILWEELTEGA